jgi:hypothetical protein
MGQSGLRYGVAKTQAE